MMGLHLYLLTTELASVGERLPMLTPQETIASITNDGIMVVISAIMILMFTIMFYQILKRQEKYDNKIVEILEKVTEALNRTSASQADSAREKRELSEVIVNSTEVSKQMIYMFQRSIEKNEYDDEFFQELRAEINQLVRCQNETVGLVREILRKQEIEYGKRKDG